MKRTWHHAKFFYIASNAGIRLKNIVPSIYTIDRIEKESNAPLSIPDLRSTDYSQVKEKIKYLILIG
ncbi:hypothetical protein D3C75_1250490 [compost metagenome]